MNYYAKHFSDDSLSGEYDAEILACKDEIAVIFVLDYI